MQINCFEYYLTIPSKDWTPLIRKKLHSWRSTFCLPRYFVDIEKAYNSQPKRAITMLEYTYRYHNRFFDDIEGYAFHYIPEYRAL